MPQPLTDTAPVKQTDEELAAWLAGEVEGLRVTLAEQHNLLRAAEARENHQRRCKEAMTDLWTSQAGEAEKKLLAENNRLRSLVQEVANLDPRNERHCCDYCGCWAAEPKEDMSHSPDCLWLRAKDLIKEAP